MLYVEFCTLLQPPYKILLKPRKVAALVAYHRHYQGFSSGTCVQFSKSTLPNRFHAGDLIDFFGRFLCQYYLFTTDCACAKIRRNHCIDQSESKAQLYHCFISISFCFYLFSKFRLRMCLVASRQLRLCLLYTSILVPQDFLCNKVQTMGFNSFLFYLLSLALLHFLLFSQGPPP